MSSNVDIMTTKVQVDHETIKSLINQMKDIQYRDERNGYLYDNTRVPRVTSVLSAMLHDDKLMDWSNSLGFKKIDYSKFLKEAAEKGNHVHRFIAEYIKNKDVAFRIDDDYIRRYKMSAEVLNTIYSCMAGFCQWWELNSTGKEEFEPVFIEHQMIGPLFGGTCDLVVKVDGKYWLVDHKTSAHMNFKYSIQLAAYRYLLRELEGIEIDRAIVLRLDKNKYTHEEYALDVNIPEQKKFLDDCEQLFMVLLTAFKMRYACANEYRVAYKRYNY